MLNFPQKNDFPPFLVVQSDLALHLGLTSVQMLDIFLSHFYSEKFHELRTHITPTYTQVQLPLNNSKFVFGIFFFSTQFLAAVLSGGVTENLADLLLKLGWMLEIST